LFPSEQSITLPVRNSIPMAYASNKQTAEFKVPFLPNRTTCLIKTLNDNYDTYLADNFANGYLYLAVYYEGLPPLSLASLYNFKLHIEILQAFGDETTFGVWLGLPKMYVAEEGTTNFAIGPDQWFNPAITQKKPAEKESLLGSSNKTRIRISGLPAGWIPRSA